jgi:hypothetical protein
MPETEDFVAPFFSASQNPKPYLKTGAIGTAAALLYSNIPIDHIEGTAESVLFCFDNTDSEAERIEQEHTGGKLKVVSSLFVRCTFRVRDAMGEFRRQLERKPKT